MKCPECQFENREGAKFCSGCGNRFDLFWPGCSTSIRASSKYRDECGCLLEPPHLDALVGDSEIENLPIESAAKINSEDVFPIVGERKHVTLLFSDLSDCTAESERLDPEDVKNIITHIYDDISKRISKYEGFIEKYAGDAVMARFGAPRVHDDDPIRAILAVREIHCM